MTLFGIGPGELVLIFILALIIFGPQRLPEVARAIGKAINDFRKTSEEVTSAVARELDISEVVQSGAETAPAPPPAIRPVHSIPLSRVGEAVAVGPAESENVPAPTAANDIPANVDADRETHSEGGRKPHD